MRLEDLTTGHVRRAIELYCQLAWGSSEAPGIRFDLARFDDCVSVEAMLGHFEREETDTSKRYSLRLGNRRYPFMKFVLQEYLIRGEYFFSVDTHDNLDVRPDSPDWAAWEELKRHNHDLKREIEDAWGEAGLPTYEDLRRLAEELASVETESKKRRRLLVCDDEAHVAMGLKALLRARGYEVELAHDGAEVMARLGRDPLPDLLLLDLEMPVVDGQEVLKRMRGDERLRDLPVLLATASEFDMSRLQRISGYLRKPYPRQVLCAMIAKLLETADREGGRAAEPR